MTLLELLVKELPKRGGWPEEISEFITQDGDGTVFCWAGAGLFMAGNSWCIKTGDRRQIIFPKTPNPATDYNSAIITRQQYEVALAASKKEWDGAGLPPVGFLVERSFNNHHFHECKIVAHSLTSSIPQAAFCDVDGGLNGWGIESAFRPILSEADKKRRDGVLALARVDEMVAPFEYGSKMRDGSLIGSFWYDLYDAIAAGKIPGIKLED